MINLIARQLSILFFLSLPLLGPQADSQIHGRVTDSEGAPIPGTIVTLSGGAISPRSVITNENGIYRFVSVPQGDYTIKVEMPGFFTREFRNVRASVHQAVELNISLVAQGTTSLPPPPPPEKKLMLNQEQLFSSEVDEQIKQLALGLVEYNPPAEMTEQTPERIEVRVSQSLTEDLTRGLRGRGIPEVEKVLVGSTMKATLSGKEFDVSALSESIQSVFSTGFTQWEWNVLPLKPGTKILHLSIAAIFDTKYGAKAKSYPVMEKAINVKVNPNLHPFEWEPFLKKTALILGVIATLISILTVLIKAIKKKRAGAH